MPTAPPTTTPQFKCTVCGRTDFRNAQHLGAHMRNEHPAKEDEGKPLTRTTIIKRFPGYFRRIHQMGGCGPAFEKFPHWKIKLTARGEPMQTIYDALSHYRKDNGLEAPVNNQFAAANAAREKARKNHHRLPEPDLQELYSKAQQEQPKRKSQRKTQRKTWTREQYDLAKALIDAPQWRMANGHDVDWERIFEKHPDYRTILDYEREGNKFASFAARVRKGGGQRAKPGLAVQHIETIPAEPVNPASGMPFVGAETNGHGVMVLGREYGLTDLERIVKHYNELRFHLKACPDCGYNLREHLKCYNIVKRHQEAARIEEEI